MYFSSRTVKVCCWFSIIMLRWFSVRTGCLHRCRRRGPFDRLTSEYRESRATTTVRWPSHCELVVSVCESLEWIMLSSGDFFHLFNLFHHRFLWRGYAAALDLHTCSSMHHHHQSPRSIGCCCSEGKQAVTDGRPQL